jgi:phytoene dehydrogenase-like protein
MAEAAYDAIVIGSGMGGMTCASLLAKLDQQRVLLLEKHYKLGGQTHEFRRGQFEWDVGLHYVGNMGKDDPPRRFMDFLTGGAVEWTRMPEDFDIFHYPDFTFAVPGDKDAYRARLKDTFPRERANIDAYFDDVHAAGRWMATQMLGKAMPSWVAPLVRLFGPNHRALALQTTKRYLDQRFEDRRLRALLASQWPDYGLSPDESAFGIHAMVSASYFNGGYYPVGGAQTIAPALVSGIEAAGGRALVDQEVTEILVENGRAVGVRAQHPQRKGEAIEYRAPVVVSNVGARTTFLRLVPPQIDLGFRDELARFPHGHSAVTCYLGLKDDPRSIGIHGENHWIYTSLDHDEMRRSAIRVLQGEPPCVFASFPSAKDPAAKAHTAELIIMVDGEGFAAWQDSRWKDRPPEYEAVKDLAKEGLLALSEKVLPGLSDLVDYAEVSTPITVEHFTSWPFGAFYGIPAVPERYQTSWTQITTPVPGLYLTGTDVASLGIPGAMMGGAFTASKLLGALGIPRVMRKFG